MGLQIEFATPSPLMLRNVPVLAFTGDELVVWGGFAGGMLFFDDGARYQLASDSWELLPAAPLTGRIRGAAAWTGSELLVAGGKDRERTFADGAAYDPSGGTWRTLPTMPDSGRREATSCWTDDRLIVFGGYDSDGNPASTVLALDPDGSDWVTLAFDPIERNVTPSVAWTGRHCVAWGGYQPHAIQPTVYDPGTDRWRIGAPAPLEPRVGHLAVPIGGRVLIWGGEYHDRGFIDGAWYDPADDRWDPIAQAPAAMPYARGVMVAGHLIVFGGHVSGRDANILTYDTTGDRWNEADVPFWPGGGNAAASLAPDRAAVWTGFQRNQTDLAILSF